MPEPPSHASAAAATRRSARRRSSANRGECDAWYPAGNYRAVVCSCSAPSPAWTAPPSPPPPEPRGLYHPDRRPAPTSIPSPPSLPVRRHGARYSVTSSQGQPAVGLLSVAKKGKTISDREAFDELRTSPSTSSEHRCRTSTTALRRRGHRRLHGQRCLQVSRVWPRCSSHDPPRSWGRNVFSLPGALSRRAFDRRSAAWTTRRWAGRRCSASVIISGGSPAKAINVCVAEC